MGEQDKKHGYSAELVRLVEKDTTYEEEFYNNGKPKYLKTTKTGRLPSEKRPGFSHLMIAMHSVVHAPINSDRWETPYLLFYQELLQRV